MCLWAHGLISPQEDLLEGDLLCWRLCAFYMLVDTAKLPSNKEAAALYHSANLPSFKADFLKVTFDAATYRCAV